MLIRQFHVPGVDNSRSGWLTVVGIYSKGPMYDINSHNANIVNVTAIQEI